MSIASLIRSMAEAGAPAEAIALAVEAIECAEAKIESARAAARERKRRQRERDVTITGQSRDKDGTVTPTPPPLPLSPQTPLTPTPPPGDITTREGVCVKAGPTRAQVASGFLAFWAAYPKRKAKDAAAKAFAKAMGRIEAEDPLAVILAGIERALPGWDDPQFIPYPASWLNAGSWDDEAPTPRNGLTRNDRPNRPDKTAERADNYAAAWSGADRAAALLADRGNF